MLSSEDQIGLMHLWEGQASLLRTILFTYFNLNLLLFENCVLEYCIYVISIPSLPFQLFLVPQSFLTS